MAEMLSGRRVAILAARGVEQVELVQPRQAVTDAGAIPAFCRAIVAHSGALDSRAHR